MTETRIQWSPHDHQQQAYDSEARFRVVAAGRRSGKTTLAAVETVERAFRGGSDWAGAWVTPGHAITETGFRTIDDAVTDDWIRSRKQSPPYRHEFRGGGRLDYLTTGGDPNVSEGYDWLVIDEAGKDVPERAWTQELRPTLSNTGGEALFISTPEGKDWFHDWWQRDTGGVFDVEDASAAYDPGSTDGTPPYRIGVDLARSEDYLAIVVLDSDGRVPHLTRERDLSWPQIQRRVEQVADQFGGAPVGIDATRDNKLVSDLETAGVDIRPVTFSAQRKQALVENLAGALEAGEVTVPEDTSLATELSVFEYETTRAGNIRYGAPDGHHDDTVDALAMAYDLPAGGGIPTARASFGGDGRADASADSGGETIGDILPDPTEL